MRPLQSHPADGPIRTVDQLEDRLSDPPDWLVDRFRSLPGDLLLLGVAGKMGPTLARMARRASDAAGVPRTIYGASRFSDPAEIARLESAGVRCIRGDLLDPARLAALPDAPNVVYMAGMKFGSTGQRPLTWAMNAFLPGLVAARFPTSRIAAFSTGNVYGLVPVSTGGSVESDAPNPVGEYAMSCLGRERLFEHFSQSRGTPVSILRLNYACELRYGVLVDLARKVWDRRPIDLAMSHFNVLWQADANAQALASLAHAASPATILNLAGPETLSVRRTCETFARLLDRPVTFTGTESPDALLNNANKSRTLFGPPSVSADTLIHWVADWTRTGGPSLDKPTHFESRDGKF